MRNLFTWSAGICTLCATLAQAQVSRSSEAPNRRSFLPADERQSVNKLAPRDGLRALAETPEARTFLSGPSTPGISEEKAAKYAMGTFDIQSLDRNLQESSQRRNLTFLRPAPGEKANTLPTSVQTRNLNAPSVQRFWPEERSVKPRFFPLPSDRR
jgi:hypothetical protein